MRPLVFAFFACAACAVDADNVDADNDFDADNVDADNVDADNDVDDHERDAARPERGDLLDESLTAWRGSTVDDNDDDDHDDDVVVDDTDGEVVDDSIADAAAGADDDSADVDSVAVDDDSVDGACVDGDLPLVNAGIVEPPGVAGCPAGMAPIDDSRADGPCMDRYEAFLATASGAPLSPFAHPADDADIVAHSAPGAVPQGYISGRGAAAACAAAGKRLCSDEEWLRACRGSASTTYPYGDARAPGVCNDARAVHPAVEYFGTAADWIWSALGHPCINQLADSVAPAGAHPGCVDDSGLHFDLMGNLHEWTSDPQGTFRGGFYVDTVRNGAGCLYRTTAHDVSHWDYSTGFRCCADR